MIVAIASLIVGAALSVAISRYYYKRSLRHRLAIYVFQSSRLFRDVDSAIRKALTIQFHGAPVEQLVLAELLIANEGVHAVRDCVQPLTIALPDDARFVDASILYVHPDGRQVSTTLSSARKCICEFEILNAGEYFLLRIIIDGRTRVADLRCSIVAENLPPRIAVEFEPVETRERSRFDFVAPLVFGVAAGLLGGSILATLVLLRDAQPSLFPFPPSGFEFSFGSSLVIFVAGTLGVLLTLIGLGFLAASVFGGVIPPPRRFPLPGHFRRDHLPYHLVREIGER
jgi:hypothetical protein